MKKLAGYIAIFLFIIIPSLLLFPEISSAASDFTLSATPLRHVVNPNWEKDYTIGIIPVNGFSDFVDICLGQISGPPGLAEPSVQFWQSGTFINDSCATVDHPNYNTITGRTRDLNPDLDQAARGANFHFSFQAAHSSGLKQQDVDFYINQRPNARDKAIGSTNINPGQSVKIRDNGSADPDILAPGNVLTMVIADFNNDATLDFGGNLIGVDKCFIAGDSGNICNALWPGSASPDPINNDWEFRYDSSGAYSVRYFVFDDLIADAQAVNWTERFKSAGMAAEIPVTVGSAPSQAPTAVIEIKNDNSASIDKVLPNQIFYADVSKSSDSDGTISQVSFCVDTTPEASGAPKVCDSSWIFPYFDWNTPDFARGWLAVAKKLKKQISQAGTYAIYAAVSDNSGMLSKAAMDTITVINPPPIANNQSVATNQNTPVDVILSGSQENTGVVNIDSRYNIHTLALKSDGAVWAWGNNDAGQIGSGSLGGNILIPSKVSSVVGFNRTPLNNVIKISAGMWHNLALKSDGTAWAWGDFDYGKLGNQTISGDSPAAVQVQFSGFGAPALVDIAASDDYSLALDADGAVWAWGRNKVGNFCDNNFNTNIYQPFQLSNINNVIDISTMVSTSLFLKIDGTVWRCGARDAIGPPNPTLIPEKMPVLNDIVAMKGGMSHFLALKSDGTVWAWGTNWFGELGDNQSCGNDQCLIPVQIPGLSSIIDIDAGGETSYALKSDGTVWAWGKNNYGQLGDGTVTDRLIPVQVSGQGGREIVDITDSHSLNLSGAEWSWGSNNYGQLGNNTISTAANPTPVQTQFSPSLTYIITFPLPDNGTLKTSAGTPITSVPYTLPDNIVNYTPNLNFSSPPTNPFKFKVNDGFQDSAPGTITVTVNPVSPLPPTSLTGSAFCAGSDNPDITLAWTDNSDNETGFKIYRGLDQNFTPDSTNLITTTAADTTTYTDTTPAVSTTYYYKIKAFNTAGDSQFAVSPAITTLSCAPTFALIPASVIIPVGGTAQFDGSYDSDGPGGAASTTPDRDKITWSSDDENIAKINLTGLVTGVAAGPTKINGKYKGITATVDVTVTPTPTYTLTVTIPGSSGNISASGINCGNGGADCMEIYAQGASVTLTATPNTGAGYSHGTWNGACGAGGTETNCSFAMDADKNVGATFTALPAEADIRANDLDAITVPYNSSVRIKWCGTNMHPCVNAKVCKVDKNIGGNDISTALSGYYDTPALTADITYFLECANSAGDTSYDNVKVTVSAQVSYTLTVSKAGAGSGAITSPPPPPRINCQASCASDSVSFTSGASVTLTADPTIGSSFAGWSGDADCSDGNVTMDAAKTCTATFNVRPAAINLLAPNWSVVQAGQLGALKAYLSWQFSDPNPGATESTYQLIADIDNNPLTPPLLDTGKCSGYNQDYNGNPEPKCRINLEVDRYPLHEQISLAYGQKYYWWVKVWNNLGLESSLKQYDTEPDTDNDDGDPLTFTTYSHEMPRIDFNWFPVNPSRGQATKFNNISQYYSMAAPATPTDCDDSHCSYLWIVPAGATIDDNKAKNPKITFNFSGVASVTLTVADKEGYVTSLTKILNLKQKLPSWREVKPE